MSPAGAVRGFASRRISFVAAAPDELHDIDTGVADFGV
jgi:hypothetical protein